MVKHIHTSGNPDSRKLRALIKEHNIQKQEHPWLDDLSVWKISEDHINLKQKGGKSHG